MDVKEAKPEKLLTAAESWHIEGNAKEIGIIDTTDSGTCDSESTSLTSEMFKRKSQGGVASSEWKGQRTKQTTSSRQADEAASESSQTAGNESKTLSSVTASKTAKLQVKSIEVEKQSEASSQKLPDQNDGGPSTPTSPKSKIPVRSASAAEVKPPVAPDKAVTRVSGAVVTLKSQKGTETKKSLKAVNGQSVDEANAEKTREIREASPTKTANKANHVSEKSEVGCAPVKLLNGVVNDRTAANVKATRTPVRKDAQKNLDGGDATSSRLPVSVQARKKNQEAAEASGTDGKAAAETEAERCEAAQKQSAAAGLGETTPKATAPPLPASPKKGKANTKYCRSLNLL